VPIEAPKNCTVVGELSGFLLAHAANWGSRGRRFKSCRPDSERVSVGQRLTGALISLLGMNVRSSTPLLDSLTRAGCHAATGFSNCYWSQPKTLRGFRGHLDRCRGRAAGRQRPRIREALHLRKRSSRSPAAIKRLSIRANRVSRSLCRILTRRTYPLTHRLCHARASSTGGGIAKRQMCSTQCRGDDAVGMYLRTCGSRETRERCRIVGAVSTLATQATPSGRPPPVSLRSSG
jgi:hypothetical protein